MENCGAANSVEVRDYKEVVDTSRGGKADRLAHAGTVEVSAGY